MEWKRCKIGDVCTINDDQYSLKENWSEALYLDTGSITANKIDVIQKIDDMENNLPSRARRKVQNLDIIYSTVRPNQKHYGILQNPEKNLLVSTGFSVIRANPLIANPFYLYYLLTQDSIVNYLHSLGEQAVSAYPSIKPQDIADLLIDLPQLNKQNKIASILSSLDAKIENNNKINANLEAQAQALFKSWFVDFEPFQDGEFQDSELGRIPKGWKVGKLSEIANITMGQSPSGSTYNENHEGTEFYQGSADFGWRFPNERVYTTEPLRFAESNSILMSVRAPVGTMNISLNKCCIGRGLASIQSKDNSNSFVFYLMDFLKPLLNSYNGDGTVFGSINKKSLETLPIIKPPQDVIDSFEKIVSPLDGIIKNNSVETKTLSTLRDTLLPKLMSGEIEV